MASKPQGLPANFYSTAETRSRGWSQGTKRYCLEHHYRLQGGCAPCSGLGRARWPDANGAHRSRSWWWSRRTAVAAEHRVHLVAYVTQANGCRTPMPGRGASYRGRGHRLVVLSPDMREHDAC